MLPDDLSLGPPSLDAQEKSADALALDARDEKVETPV